ncbi:MAG: bifunctional 4-hydroxy-3-methylbut-2-enyl diphosphate reductase/30S ribosomal protein S1 [Ruminococcaceae bacterium]|nr:bifunctional 4-hydroxy-3-methylbut-2-enyl diphosphate reductase/30S ribosomal protein S1 [Oscillospiraceae bacterium]
MSINITVAKTAGFCFGVKNAMTQAEKLAENGGGYTLGQLIHNPFAIKELEKKGVFAIDTLDEAKDGKTVIIRSHGVGQAVYDELKRQNIPYIDATCPKVVKIHKIVEEESAKGANVLIAGDPNHPEVKGIMGHCHKNVKVWVVNSLDDIESLVKNEKSFVHNALIFLSQTTGKLSKWIEYKKIVKKHCTNLKIFDTICKATTCRQTEAEDLASKCDLMIVVGGRESSNTAKLADISKKYCKTFFTESAEALPVAEIKAVLSDLAKKSSDINIGITAGASTPYGIIKEVHRFMSEITKNDEMDIDFMAEVDKTFKRVYIGNRVKAYVVAVNNTEAIVDIGTKHSGYIPADELTATPGLLPKDVVKPGDEIECVVTNINDQDGIVYLSKKRVDAAAGLEKLADACNNNTTVTGIVTSVVKGGVIVTCEGSRVFVPASHTGVSRGRRGDQPENPEELAKKLETLLKKEVKLKIIEVSEGRGKVVGSIKNAAKEESDALKEKFWSEIEVGKKYVGEVKSMESYGVFVDLGGVDGMVHSSELTWNRIKHPKEVVSVGDKLEVYVKSYDPEKKRVSLGAKNPDDNPWTKFLAEFAVGDVVKVQVVSITPFGAFAQIIPGVDGLIHISQISLDRVTNVAQYLTVGQVVEAKITEVDEEKSRVSLSIKELLEESAGDEEEAAEEETEGTEEAAE